MALQVIGSGFGRTGTRSLKQALEFLGFGPCHHMEELFENPAQIAFWQAIARDETADWEKVFDGYSAQIDWPGCHVWRELAAAYPEAKVIHSHRDPEKWWASFSQTIGKLMSRHRDLPGPPHVREIFAVVEEIIGQRTFGGNWTDKGHVLEAYHARAIAVREAIPAERLLFFDVTEGWAPLCAFLGVPVPDTPFPRRNDKAEFWTDAGGEPA